jgi:hypothetical protein
MNGSWNDLSVDGTSKPIGIPRNWIKLKISCFFLDVVTMSIRNISISSARTVLNGSWIESNLVQAYHLQTASMAANYTRKIAFPS